MQFPSQLAKQTSKAAVASRGHAPSSKSSMKSSSVPRHTCRGRLVRCSRPANEPSRSSAGRVRRIRYVQSASRKFVTTFCRDACKLTDLVDGRPGEVKARIVERDGQIIMEKSCEKHGVCVDVMSIDPKFMARIESLFPGRDFPTVETTLRSHGSSSMKYGRGAVATIDLTNPRCNTWCTIRASWTPTKSALSTSCPGTRSNRSSTTPSTSKPAPPDEHPVFWWWTDAVAALPRCDSLRTGRRLLRGAVRDQRPALRWSPVLRRKPKRPVCAWRISSSTQHHQRVNAHRKIANLFDVKLRAIEELHRALASTSSGGDAGERRKQRSGRQDRKQRSKTATRSPSYRSSRWALPVAMKMSMMTQKAALYAVAPRPRHEGSARRHRADARLVPAIGHGSVFQPDRSADRNKMRSLVPSAAAATQTAASAILFVNKRTKQMVPLLEFLDVEQFARTSTSSPMATCPKSHCDGGDRPWRWFATSGPNGRRKLRSADAVLSSFCHRPARAAKVGSLVRCPRVPSGASCSSPAWFQDLFNYDFRHQKCASFPYGTQMGRSASARTTWASAGATSSTDDGQCHWAEWYKTARSSQGVRQRTADRPADVENPLTSRLPGVPNTWRTWTRGKLHCAFSASWPLFPHGPGTPDISSPRCGEFWIYVVVPSCFRPGSRSSVRIRSPSLMRRRDGCCLQA